MDVTPSGAVPLSNLLIFIQCCGIRPSRDQAPGECQPGISIIRRSVANGSRLRDSAHDPERSREMVAEGDVVGQIQFIRETLDPKAEPSIQDVGWVWPDGSFLQYNLQQRITSNFRCDASPISRLSSGLLALVPLQPASTYSPAFSQPWRRMYSRSSASCSSQFWSIVETLA